eukprot:3577090-Amphidinium_carterae.1
MQMGDTWLRLQDTAYAHIAKATCNHMSQNVVAKAHRMTRGVQGLTEHCYGAVNSISNWDTVVDQSPPRQHHTDLYERGKSF